MTEVASGEDVVPLIESGVSLSDIKIRGYSPLVYFCSVMDEELAVDTVKRGVDVNINEAGPSSYTALHFASDFAMTELVAALLAAGALMDRGTEDIPVPFGTPIPGKSPESFG
jgi:hypothetical protein